MTSTFSGLEIGKRGIMAHEQALQVTGHNLTNSETEGYSRQRLEMKTFEPLYMPGLNRAETPGQLGQGTAVERIARVRDELLDKRIIAQAGGEGYWQARDPYVRQIEHAYLEVGGNSLRAKLDAFWDSWQELANFPTESAPRTALLERGKTLVDGIHGRFESLKSLQQMADEDIALTVDRVNELSRQIAALNIDIQRIRAQGDNPNDLLDRRDLLVDKLSSIVPVTAERRDSDEFMLHIDGIVFVQGGIGRQLELRPAFGAETRNIKGSAVTMPENRSVVADGYGRVVWADSGEDFAPHPQQGSLSALIEMRDSTLREELQNLDTFTMNFMDLVNESHRTGYGSNGRTGLDFFNEHHFVTNVMGNYDRNGDGEYDSTYIFRVNGTNKLEPRAQLGIEGNITLAAAVPQNAGRNVGDAAGGNFVTVPYYPEDTVTDIINRINSSASGVSARLNKDGVLQLKAGVSANPNEPDFVLQYLQDDGRFLAGYAGVLAAQGEEGAFNWEQADAAGAFAFGTENFSTAPVAHPSGWIEINSAILKEPASIAAGYGENGRIANPGNGEAALAIAAIRNNPVMVGRLGTFDDYFADAVARAGMLGEQSGRALETQNLIMKQLHDMRSSVSGVNMDEELAAMIKYQHGYAA
jgi:flagellar hook-associated protein 1 FlgK